MRRKSPLPVFLFLLFVHTVSAQYQENLPQAKPIPPNAAALFKTLERPIGTYTGTIPISFPLCGISSGSLSANLSLDYNSTGGIRVEEIAGPVGLGFNLSDGGGRITQIVRGRPDDLYGILNHPSSIRPSNFGCYLGNMEEMNDYELMEIPVDLEPDIFMYSFNGHSGKFFLKENGDVILTKNDGIKIEYGADPYYGIGGWTITDEKGNKYEFGTRTANESGYSSFGGTGSSSISSVSWFLSSIKDMNEENTISFTYVYSGTVFSTYSGGFLPLTPLPGTCAQMNTSYDQGSVTTDGSEYLVSRIDAQSGYILVNSVGDPYGPKKVSSIELYDPAGTLKKKYKFNYSGSLTSPRLMLSNFSEFPTSGTDSLTTKFEYNTFNSLPDVFSPSVDMWGYYNGAGNYNTGLIPKIIYPVYWANVFLDWTSWADRTASDAGSQASILKKISYPTGGYREIDYEGHMVLPQGDFYWYHPDYAFEATYSAERNFNETNFVNSGTFWPCLQHLFTINSNKGYARFNYTLNNPSWECGSYRVKIMKLLDSTDMEGGVEVQNFTAQSTGSKLLFNGYYRIDVYIAGSYDWACTMDGIEGSWNEFTLVDTFVNTPYGNGFPKTARRAGGVRVKEVRDYDPVTNKVNRTQFKYKMYSTDSTLTSGLLVSAVDIFKTQNSSTSGCEYTVLCPGSSYPLASESGSYVVYPEVRTIDSANGWTDHIYSYSQDIGSNSFPQMPTEDMSFRRGHLTEEKVYNNSGTLLTQKLQNYTERFSSGSQSGYRYKPYWYVGAYNAVYTDSKPGPYNLPDLLACQQYGVMGIFWTLNQTINKQYSTATGNMVDTIKYTYGNYNNYYYLKNEVTKNSTGLINQRSYKYAFTTNSDFKFGLSSYEQSMKTTLLDKNLYLPLEVIDSVKTSSGGSLSFLHGSKYLFGKYNPDSLIHLKTFRSFPTATDSSEIYFSAYDSSGNLREQYKANDAKEIILWGYNRTYPVAKITGSTLSTVLGLVNVGVLNSPSSESALRTELDKIRTGLAGSVAQVTTYTYNLLYGMSSMTDPSGKTVYYEYDLFGRLKLVRDQDKRIIKKYEYKLNNPL